MTFLFKGEIGMSAISADLQDFVNNRRRDAAIIIDGAEQAIPAGKRDNSFQLATMAIRGWRPRIEACTERETLARCLKGLVEDLSIVSGQAANAAAIALDLVGEAHLIVITARDDIQGGIHG
jgi:hypothetical protein